MLVRLILFSPHLQLESKSRRLIHSCFVWNPVWSVTGSLWLTGSPKSGIISQLYSLDGVGQVAVSLPYIPETFPASHSRWEVNETNIVNTVHLNMPAIQQKCPLPAFFATKQPDLNEIYMICPVVVILCKENRLSDISFWYYDNIWPFYKFL